MGATLLRLLREFQSSASRFSAEVPGARAPNGVRYGVLVRFELRDRRRQRIRAHQHDAIEQRQRMDVHDGGCLGLVE